MMRERNIMNPYVPFALFQELLTHNHFFPITSTPQPIFPLWYYFEANPRHKSISYVNITVCISE